MTKSNDTNNAVHNKCLSSISPLYYSLNHTSSFLYTVSDAGSCSKLRTSEGIGSFFFCGFLLRLLIRGSDDTKSIFSISSIVCFLEHFRVFHRRKNLLDLLRASWASSESWPMGTETCLTSCDLQPTSFLIARKN